MKKYCDLHTHSVFSDGTWTPSQIIEKAGSLGLSSVALCDHNTVSGLPDFLSAAEGKDIEAVCGCEFSVDYEGRELHLLGLFIRPERFSDVSSLMDSVIARKEQSNIDLVSKLNNAGYAVDYDKIKAENPGATINRAHIARELTRLHYTTSVSEAFSTLLSPAAGFYVEPERLTVWQVIEFICSIGAVPVLAHPFLELNELELREFLTKAAPLGLCGIEAEYPLFDSEERALLRDIARDFGILTSGGSDFHGETKPDTHIGIGTGDLRVPSEWANELSSLASLV
ncbi:MAG: PHP domain-containing protein [Clostridia bacterium]|nr:PHP domain-containing protein [Clostridia bacterium]